MINWKKLCSDRTGYTELHSVLDNCFGRSYYLDDVVLPHSCGDTRCTVVFKKSYDGITVSCEQAPIHYDGTDPVIERWLSEGTASFNNYSELDSFLMSFAFEDEKSAGSSCQSAVMPAPAPDPAQAHSRDPRSIYDRESVSVPSSDSSSIVIDKERLTLELSGEIFGCAAIVTFAINENRKNGKRCFLGMFDPSARPLVPENELTFTIPMRRFKEMLGTMNDSALYQKAFSILKKRINRTTL